MSENHLRIICECAALALFCRQFARLCGKNFLPFAFNAIATDIDADRRIGGLTTANFRGISPRACGPWRTVPAAIILTNYTNRAAAVAVAPDLRSSCNDDGRFAALRRARQSQQQETRGEHVSVTGRVKFFNEGKGFPLGPVFIDTGDIDGKAVAAIPFQILVP